MKRSQCLPVLLGQGRAKGCVAASKAPDASMLGSASPDSSCTAIRKVKRKTAERGLLGKAQSAQCAYAFSSSGLSEGSACVCGTNDGAGVGQYLLM